MGECEECSFSENSGRSIIAAIIEDISQKWPD